jgi:adenosylcobinamide-phosphate synthase
VSELRTTARESGAALPGRAGATSHAPASRGGRTSLLVAAVALDLLLGEPPALLHPVAWLGSCIDRAERAAPAPEQRASLVYGAVAVAGLCGVTGAVAAALQCAAGRLPYPLRLLALAALLKPSFALRELLEASEHVREALAAGNLAQARASLRALVSRETATLSAEDVAGAAIESLAENTTDSFIGPWLAWLLCGLPGAWVFRTINTLDSRWGYHGRYELLGCCAARLDDAAAMVPARLSAIVLIAAAAVTGARPWQGLRAMWRDHARTSSPNAGWTMATMAGALGLRLAKHPAYLLNAEGVPAGVPDIARAQRIVAAAAVLMLGASLLLQSILIKRNESP